MKAIILLAAIAIGVFLFIKSNKKSKKSSGSGSGSGNGGSGGGGVIYTDDVVGPKPTDGHPQIPSEDPTELRDAPDHKDLKDFR
jgi:hypothetical protein